jgi:hypothetical protein
MKGDITMERWVNLKEFNLSKYAVSNTGQVRGPHGIRKPWADRDGYLMLTLYNDSGKQVTRRLHRLVALAFIPNPNNLPEVNHKDGNKENCYDWNLEWVTTEINIRHGFQHNLYPTGEAHHRATLTDAQVQEIRIAYVPRHKQYGQAALARKYNVSQGAIFHIIHADTRKQRGIV